MAMFGGKNCQRFHISDGAPRRPPQPGANDRVTGGRLAFPVFSAPAAFLASHFAATTYCADNSRLGARFHCQHLHLFLERERKIMAHQFTTEWMQNLGREDGAAVADWVVDELSLSEAPDQSRRVGKSAVGRIKQLVRKYESRGVSEALINVWRKECVGEIYRRFAELRAQTADAVSIAADPIPLPEPRTDKAPLETARGEKPGDLKELPAPIAGDV